MKLFNEENVEYLVVGGYAVMAYAEPRYTKDIDIWVRPSEENARRVFCALHKFGAPLTDVEVEDFTNRDIVYQIGVAPNRVDIIMQVEGLDFESSWPARTEVTYGGVSVPILGLDDLIRAKMLAARPLDLIDAEWLEKSREEMSQRRRKASASGGHPKAP